MPGDGRISRIEPAGRGASGATLFRVERDAGSAYLIRIEGPRTPLFNPHQYTCMQIAAEAGVSPPIRHIDPDGGVAVMAWIPARPLAEFPGGPLTLVCELGRLTRRLQETPVFPEFRDYALVLERLLTVMRGRCAPGLLDPHAAGLEALTAAYPWNAGEHVSSHNDVNPRNVLFDGQRLWLVDWETAYRNDPFMDLATTAEHCAPTPDLEDVLLAAWKGGAVGEVARAPSRHASADTALLRRTPADDRNSTLRPTVSC